MTTSATLVPAKETAQVHKTQDTEKLARSAFAMLDEYAQRKITLGELIRRRREELGLTHIQVIDKSGYFLYRSHELEALENGELKPVHDIWFTILCDPLQLDYEQFFDAHERKRPGRSRPTVILGCYGDGPKLELAQPKVRQLVTIMDEAEELQNIALPEVPKRQTRRARSLRLDDNWLTRQTLAKMVGLSTYEAGRLAEHVIICRAELSRWRRVEPMGKTQRQTLYHHSLVRHILLHLKLMTDRADWLTLPQLARILKVKPEDVTQVIQDLVKQGQLPESCRWRTLSSQGQERIYFHPDLAQVIHQPLKAYLQKHQWLGKCRLAKQVGATPADVDWMALHLIKMDAARIHQRRVVSRRKNAEVVEYHPDLARQIQKRYDAARQKRQAELEQKRELKRQEVERRRLERQQRRTQAKTMYNGWSFKAQAAKQAKVSLSQVDCIAQKLISNGHGLESWRQVSGGKKQPRVRYHPELVALVVAQAEIERNAQAEAKRRQLDVRRSEAKSAKLDKQQQRSNGREIRRRHKEWLDRTQVAKQLGVTVDAVGQAVSQLLCTDHPSAVHPLIEVLLAPEMVDQIGQILRDSNDVA